MNGFWTWAMAHELLAFFVFLSALKSIRVICKSIFRIWWAPALPSPRDPEDDAEEEREPVVAARPGRAEPVVTGPPAARRSVWSRILDD